MLWENRNKEALQDMLLFVVVTITLFPYKGTPLSVISSFISKWFIDRDLMFSGASGAANRYSSQFISAAKLLHWNGHYKPWGRSSSYVDVWDKWYIPDPTGKFHPIRRHSGDK